MPSAIQANNETPHLCMPTNLSLKHVLSRPPVPSHMQVFISLFILF